VIARRHFKSTGRSDLGVKFSRLMHTLYHTIFSRNLRSAYVMLLYVVCVCVCVRARARVFLYRACVRVQAWRPSTMGKQRMGEAATKSMPSTS
jgi:hypothetical protein